MLEKIKQHWLISILLVCTSVAAATWKLAHEVLVQPRDLQISQLKDETSKLKEEVRELKSAASISTTANRSTDEASLALAETGVFEKASATTTDGRCTVRIVRISNDRITVAITIDSLEPKVFENQEAGTRVVAQSTEKFYYVDLHRIRGGIVDLSVHQRKR